MSRSLGQHISDPRALSDALAGPDQQDMYSNLGSYIFGSPRPPSPSSSLSPYDAPPETPDPISPLTAVLPRLSPDRTPRPSVSASPPLHNVCSHPSQGPGRPAFSLRTHSRRQSSTDLSPPAVDLSTPRPRAVSGSSVRERSEDPTPSSDPTPITAAYFSPQRGSVMSDNASHHTFGPASRIHGATAAPSQDGDVLSSSSVSVTTSRSSSRASMHTSEQFSDDEIEICDAPSPVTFARNLPDIDEYADFDDPGPSAIRSSFLDGRRGSLPMAIPGVAQGGDAYSSRSREGSILTVRRPSRSWDAASARRSSHSGEDPSFVFPRSEPNSRADWRSLEVQQAPSTNAATDDFDVQYIFSRRSEGSIRSFMRVDPNGRTSPYVAALALSQGSFITLPGEDTFTRLIRQLDPQINSVRYYWSFQREKADPSSSSLLRRQQAFYRADKSGKEVPPRVQEMWRCGHVGRFKVERLAFKPQSADPAKGAQQRIHIRNIPDPFLNIITAGPHSIIHKHSRAVAFSIFRSHGLFARQAGGSGSNAQTHVNMRLAIMLAPKHVQEQYTSTKTVRQLVTHRLLDNESLGGKDKERKRGQDREERSKGKGKNKSQSRSKGKSKSKDKSDSKHRLNTTESTESSTAASSTGGVTTSAVYHLVTASEQPAMNIQLSPSASSSFYKHDPTSRPASPTSSPPPSFSKISDSEPSPISPIRFHRDHRDSIDSDDRFPPRTTHAEAFSALDPNDIENLRAKAGSGRSNADSGPTKLTERLLRVFRSNPKPDDHLTTNTQPRAFHPPWLTTTGRDQQEENDRVLSDLNASFRDVGLLHTSPHRSSKAAGKRKSGHSILDQIPDDYLYMLLPLWPGETDTDSIHAETSSSAASVISTIPENRRYLLVHYVPTAEPGPKDKKSEKKKAKQSHSSDSGIEADGKTICLSVFHAVARVVTYDELRLSGVRIPSEGLAINGPEWEALNYPDCVPLQEPIVVCQCEGREQGFHFMMDGLLKLGLCTREEYPIQDLSDPEAGRQEGKTILTPIGKAAVEMIWLGCLAITSFGST